MSLMLLSQASLFSDNGYIGLDSQTKVAMSKDGNVVVSYGAANTLDIYRKVTGGWNRVTRTVDSAGWPIIDVKLTNDGSGIAFSYSTTNTFYARRITVLTFNLTTYETIVFKLITSSQNIWDFDVNAIGVVFVKPDGLINIIRWSTSTVQSFTLSESVTSVWSINDTTLDFKWIAYNTSSIISIGSIAVTSETTFTKTVLNSNIGSVNTSNNDFAKSSFTYVSPTDSNLVVVTSSGLNTITADEIGLGVGFISIQAFTSNSGDKLLLVSNKLYTSEYSMTLFAKNSSGLYVLVGNQSIQTLPYSRLATNSTLTNFIVRESSGLRSYTI